MCDFKPGDEVVCVDDRRVINTNFAPAAPLTKGRVYTVVSVWFRPSIDAVCLLLAEAANASRGKDVGFRASRFRKVQRRDLQAWLSTEKTIEGPVRAPAKEKVA